jgi:hypothetical protein
MNRRILVLGCLLGLISSTVPAGGQVSAGKDAADDVLAAARKFVDASDRYLHHSKLQRGMKGYGLTVMSGTEVVRFDAEIMSVMTNWGPHQDVILARLSSQGLEKSSIVAGMSGSPVFVKDPADGKDKMIGAVAYGWSFQKEPLCGIQPITQMLAVEGVVPRASPPQSAPATKPATGPAIKSSTRSGTRPAKGSTSATPAAGEAGLDALSGQASPEYLAAILDPRKLDFTTFGWPKRLTENLEARSDSPRLVPLVTPLMVSTRSPRALAELGKLLEPLGIVPVQAGGVGVAEAEAAKNAKLIPGGGIAVVLVTGDAFAGGVGTVTEVMGDRVLAFGHPLFGEGESEVPIGPAYIHTVVSSTMRSMKLGSPLGVAGSLERDEGTGIAGRIGRKPSMIPVTVNIDWKDRNRKETYKYQVCRHRRFTPLMGRVLIGDSVGAWHDLPEQHIVQHSVDVDFGKLGRYQASNVSSNEDVVAASSDLTRAISAMVTNPLGEPVYPQSIQVDLTIQKGQSLAALLDLKLDGVIYRPGETLTGVVTIRPLRKERTTVPIRFKLPDDLPEGKYSLTVCDWPSAFLMHVAENPQRFNPRTTEQLLDAVQQTVRGRFDHLYLRLPLRQGGLALGQGELPDLPDSKAHIIAEAGKLDTFRFSRTLEEAVKVDYLISGSAIANFEVQRQPNQTILHEQRDQK